MMSKLAIPLEQIVNAYLDDLAVRNYKPKTIHGYRKNLHTFVAGLRTDRSARSPSSTRSS